MSHTWSSWKIWSRQVWPKKPFSIGILSSWVIFAKLHKLCRTNRITCGTNGFIPSAIRNNAGFISGPYRWTDTWPRSAQSIEHGIDDLAEVIDCSMLMSSEKVCPVFMIVHPQQGLISLNPFPCMAHGKVQDADQPLDKIQPCVKCKLTDHACFN